ncbi:hypothetical protein IAI53_15860 [Thauera sp. CAU 1555]|uniref:Uncharacterized protein n=1 Tax=Thauera sedimentorum TaxID=2767595 RepID=A0ABR9BFX2_9RHOO|nr:hypothetical protein [Thauera sedimentorum]MBC9073446.1 hypothetical protein [Thauera sedimentorum]MBD8504365.1 hypothetical protein [Thauera sedimentorum]
MIHTYPEAELPIPPSLAPNGERSWHWVELGLIVPHFLVKVELLSPEGWISRHILTTEFQFVLDNLNEEHARVTTVYLLSGFEADGAQHPACHEISQVWATDDDNDALIDLVFVLRTGVVMASLPWFRLAYVDSSTMRLIADLSKNAGPHVQ